MAANEPTTDEFRPLPLLGNPHIQTFLGAFLPGPAPAFDSWAHAVMLPDGDQLILYDSVPPRWPAGGRIALLVHGLGGSHRSGKVQRLGALLWRRGMRVVRIDLRGCGRAVTLARRPAHAGCSDDLRLAAAEIHRWSPASPLALVGFSLGGNIVLKLAGEVHEHPVPGLERVAAVAPPVDLDGCTTLLEQPRNRLYERHFVRDAMARALRRQRLFPDLPVVRFPRRLSLRGFDELYTAPRSGFTDALDYYRRASSLPLLPHITVPSLILTARDDPFITVEPLESLTAPTHVQVRILARGGHVGFLGWDGAGGIHWIEQQLADWLTG